MSLPIGPDGLTRRQRYYQRHHAAIRQREDALARAKRAGPEGDEWRAMRRELYRKAVDANRANAAASKKRARQRDPEAARAKERAYYAAHADIIQASRRARDPDDRRAAERVTRRKWRAAHRAEYRRRSIDSNHRRRAAEALLVSPADWRRVVARFRGCCAYCGRRAPLEQDHVIPLTRGGRHAIGNLVPACRSCNASKGDQLLAKWRSRSRSTATAGTT